MASIPTKSPPTVRQDLAAGQSQILNTTTQVLHPVSSTDYLYGADRLASVTGGVRTWYGTDRRGSVRQTLSDVAAVLTTQNYDPYGIPEGGASAGTFGYAGELQDGTAQRPAFPVAWTSRIRCRSEDHGAYGAITRAASSSNTRS